MSAKAAPKAASSNDAIFARLRGILSKHADRFSVTADTKERYCLESPIGPAALRAWGGKVKRAQIPVAWVEVGKARVSFHLMAMDPALRGEMSSDLERRMQGKTCFNFIAVDDVLFRELERLTAHGLAAFKRAGFITS
jgi:hypothetical protein